MDLNEPLNTIIDLAKESVGLKPIPPPTIHVEGARRYVVRAGALELLTNPRPAPLKVNSLDAVEQFIRENRDGLDLSKLLVHVESATKVSVVSAVDDIDAQRTVHLVATPPVAGPSFFGQYLAPDDLVVRLLTQFGDDAQRADLLAVVGNLQSEEVMTLNDDGVSQVVATKKGIKPTRETVKARYDLVAFRSFPEVTLPPAPFIVRMRGGGDGKPPAVTLIEADGGRWVIDALAAIKTYLETKLPEGVALIC